MTTQIYFAQWPHLNLTSKIQTQVQAATDALSVHFSPRCYATEINLLTYLVPRLRTSQSLHCCVPSPAWHPVNLHKCPPECVATASVPRPWEETLPKSWQAQLRQPSPGLHRDPSSPTSRTVRLRNFCQSGGCKWHLIIVLICISQITNEN